MMQMQEIGVILCGVMALIELVMTFVLSVITDLPNDFLFEDDSDDDLNDHFQIFDKLVIDEDF